MAQGAPTITSNISSLPEAVSGAAIMIDPYNINEVARAMEMVLTDEELSEKLKEKILEGSFRLTQMVEHIQP